MRRAVAVVAIGLAGCSGSGERPDAGGGQPGSGAATIVDAGRQETASEHVRLIAPSASVVFRAQLLRVLEASTRRFATQIPGGPEPVIEVHLYESESAWREAVAARLPAGMHLGRGMRRGALTIGGVSYLFDIGGHDALRLAAHEAWHAWAQRGLHDRLPLWLDEALATRAEGLYLPPGGGNLIFDPGANPTRRSHLRRLIDSGRLGSLADYLHSDPARLTDSAHALNEYYARAWVFGLLLGERDLRPRLGRALDRASRGTLMGGGDATIQTILGGTAEVLDPRWRRLAHELAGD